MKQLNHEGSLDSNEKRVLKKASKILRKNKFLSLIRNSKGITLIELMISASIGVIVTLGIASVFVFAMEQFMILVEKNAAEENTVMIAYYLRSYLSQAVDINAVTNIDPAFAISGGGTGQIDVNFELLVPSSAGIGTGDTGRFARFAVFNREAATFNMAMNAMTDANGTPTGGSALRNTGIFVKDTDRNGIDPDAKSGAVVFDVNSDGATMVPSPSDLYFTRLHNFRVQRITCNGAANGYAVEVVINSGNYNINGTEMTCLPPGWSPGGATYKIKTITLETISRYFKSASKDTWNYRAGIAGISAESPYRDILQTIKINFKDNLLTNQSLTGAAGAEQRVHGSLYFYDYIIPATRN